MNRLREKLDALPKSPGVYLFKDKSGKVIYIGKARTLRHRVRSYFQKNHDGRYQFDALVSRITDFEIIPTDSELEALILENNLIREKKPRYNVELRDDKSFPFLQVTREPFPRIFLTRRPVQDGSRYFGPFSKLVHFKPMIHVLKGLLKIRICNLPLTPESIAAGKFKKCVEYDIGRCNAPCISLEDADIYNQHIRDYLQVLQGHGEAIVTALHSRLDTLSEELKFEEAAQLRDQLRSLEKLSLRQKVISPNAVDHDVIALTIEDQEGCAVVFQIRAGRMIGRLHYILRHLKDREEGDILAHFLEQYYSVSTLIPKEIFVPSEIPDSDLLIQWLSNKRGNKVEILVPQRGEKVKFLQLAHRNAELLLGEYKRAQAKRERIPAALEQMQKVLHLSTLPKRIEAFDVSTSQGRETVASLVVFENARPAKKQYRRFAIKRVEGQDDFASIKEVVQRRYSRLTRTEQTLPDLILVDGGKGQLSAAVEALHEVGLKKQPVIGLAKRLEEVFLPGDPLPQNIPRTSSALKLLQTVRDEAHRYAISYHRLLRKKRTLESVLDNIKGIGPSKRRALLNHFGTMTKLREASLEAIADVPGFSLKLAQAVFEFLRESSEQEEH